MRAETGSGPRTPVCWASMSMVSRRSAGAQNLDELGDKVEPAPGSEC